jgi:mRNA interferase MazF
LAKAGDIVVVDFAGVHGIKRRPAVVVSSDAYHHWRPDVVVGLLTSQLAKATAPTDYMLRDWQAAGLIKPSAFRSFFYTLPSRSVTAAIGHVTDHDWQGILACMRTALAS